MASKKRDAAEKVAVGTLQVGEEFKIGESTFQVANTNSEIAMVVVGDQKRGEAGLKMKVLAVDTVISAVPLSGNRGQALEPGRRFRIVSSNNVVVAPEGDNVVLSEGTELKVIRKNAVIAVPRGQALEVGTVLTFHPNSIAVATTARSFEDVKDDSIKIKIEKEDVKAPIKIEEFQKNKKIKIEKEDVKEPIKIEEEFRKNKKIKIEKEDAEDQINIEKIHTVTQAGS